MTFNLNDYLKWSFLENSAESWIWFAAIILGGLTLKFIFSRIIIRLLYFVFGNLTKNDYSKEFLGFLKRPFGYLILLVTVVLAFEQLQYPRSWRLVSEKKFGVKMIISHGTEVLFAIVATLILVRLIDFLSFVLRQKAERLNQKANAQLVYFITELSKIGIVILSFFFILGAVFGQNVASLLTGLGIGGLAIALAAQDTIANLLGSFIIFLDKPFVAGDLVETTDFKGTVENIGLRSTRIRTLDKSLLHVPNKKLVDSVLNNITKSNFRRVKFYLGVTYSTTPSQMKQIVADIKNVLSQHPKVDPIHNVAFTTFGSSSLEIEIIYLVMTEEYEVMVKVREEINFEIISIIEKNGSSCAFPTSTVYLHQKNN